MSGKCRRWSKEEIQAIRDCYPNTPTKELAVRLKREPNAVLKKASELGVQKSRHISQLTQFGQREGKPVAPIGATRNNRGYTMIKVGENDWRLLHRVIYEQVHGPFKGTIVFRDGNRKNLDPANLALSSPSEQMRANAAWNYPQEVQEVFRLKAGLTTMINKRRKKHE